MSKVFKKLKRMKSSNKNKDKCDHKDEHSELPSSNKNKCEHKDEHSELPSKRVATKKKNDECVEQSSKVNQDDEPDDIRESVGYKISSTDLDSEEDLEEWQRIKSMVQTRQIASMERYIGQLENELSSLKSRISSLPNEDIASSPQCSKYVHEDTIVGIEIRINKEDDKMVSNMFNTEDECASSIKSMEPPVTIENINYSSTLSDDATHHGETIQSNSNKDESNLSEICSCGNIQCQIVMDTLEKQMQDLKIKLNYIKSDIEQERIKGFSEGYSCGNTQCHLVIETLKKAMQNFKIKLNCILSYLNQELINEQTVNKHNGNIQNQMNRKSIELSNEQLILFDKVNLHKKVKIVEDDNVRVRKVNEVLKEQLAHMESNLHQATTEIAKMKQKYKNARSSFTNVRERYEQCILEERNRTHELAAQLGRDLFRGASSDQSSKVITREHIETQLDALKGQIFEYRNNGTHNNKRVCVDDGILNGSVTGFSVYNRGKVIESGSESHTAANDIDVESSLTLDISTDVSDSLEDSFDDINDALVSTEHILHTRSEDGDSGIGFDRTNSIDLDFKSELANIEMKYCKIMKTCSEIDENDINHDMCPDDNADDSDKYSLQTAMDISHIILESLPDTESRDTESRDTDSVVLQPHGITSITHKASDILPQKESQNEKNETIFDDKIKEIIRNVNEQYNAYVNQQYNAALVQSHLSEEYKSASNPRYGIGLDGICRYKIKSSILTASLRELKEDESDDEHFPYW